jgi:glycosyltransferase involved in cell wall biosynthesis
MKIDHVTFAATGGSGRVAHLLMKAQEKVKHDSRILTLSPSGLRQSPFTHPSLTVRAALDEMLLKNPKSPGMLSITRRDFGSNLLASIRSDSLIHLHWVEGVINHKQIADLLDTGRKVVWTLHDSAPFTGGCHSPMGCSGFTQSCNQCPQVRPFFSSLISNSHKEISKNKFDVKNLTIVAPTKALAQDARKSTLFRGSQVEVIGNPISNLYFSTGDQSAARKRLGISDADVVGVAIAEQLENPLKQIAQLLEVFFQVTQDRTEKAVFILIGNNGKRIAEKHLNCIWLGQLNEEQIAETLPAADFLISASLSESAGMTVIEAAALGVPSIAIRNGGSDELIENEKTGILVNNLNEMELAIRAAIGDRSRLKSLGQRACIRASRSRADLVSAEYLNLYDRLLTDRGV